MGLFPTTDCSRVSGVVWLWQAMLNSFKNSLLEPKHSVLLRRQLVGGVLFVFFFTFAACSAPSSPKPYGYYRITVPDTAYVPFVQQYPNYPYTFALSANAQVKPRKDVDEPYWINIFYPSLNATIHCSYKPVRSNLRELTDDALEFVYRNASFANAIPEKEYNHPEARVYGVLFDLEGNTASSCQFFVTDSTHHFFRASVYCNCQPNADSLAPVYDYLRKDVIRMVESFEWK